jgi:hypothetical protein
MGVEMDRLGRCIDMPDPLKEHSLPTVKNGPDERDYISRGRGGWEVSFLFFVIPNAYFAEESPWYHQCSPLGGKRVICTFRVIVGFAG